MKALFLAATLLVAHPGFQSTTHGFYTVRNSEENGKKFCLLRGVVMINPHTIFALDFRAFKDDSPMLIYFTTNDPRIVSDGDILIKLDQTTALSFKATDYNTSDQLDTLGYRFSTVAAEREAIKDLMAASQGATWPHVDTTKKTETVPASGLYDALNDLEKCRPSDWT